MPTFSARGVTATLSIAPLKGTLSDTLNLSETSKQEKRVQKAFNAGQKLRERPIGPVGPNGRTPGVLQFIGTKEDIPFFMAEASERLRDGSSPEHSMIEDDPFATPLEEGTMTEMSSSSDMATLSTRAGIRLESEPQAMMLTVATSTSSHIKSLESQRAIVKTPDMKIEVFFNGALIGSEYINPRRANTKISTNRQTFFSGVRIHRQMEKPWVYKSAETLEASPQTVQAKWVAISAALKEEGYDRGVDTNGKPSPSAAFLDALSTVELPEHLQAASHLGVVDIIVSTGSGYKHGSECGFVLGPLRMASGKYKRPAPSSSDGGPSTSLDISLAERVGEPPLKKTKHDSARTSTPAIDSPMSSPQHRAQDSARLAVELGAAPTSRLVQQIAPPLPVTPSPNRRLDDLTKNSARRSPIKIKLSATRGTAKSWVKDPLPTSSDSNGPTDAAPSSDLPDSMPSQARIKTSRSAKEDPFTDAQALNNFRPPQLCEGSVVSFAGNGMYRTVPKWRPGSFDENEVVAGMRIVVT
ncbi:hypothetical protein DOTSEDRAFT_70156 [Dothistroma septosporum NZE10]|uniref:Uncharacterized protein n=1 Tax=Dothistroma septosporum (strain NZE10 / CBS 128990) TaxID=675120 RepID=N1PT03_DOTSN|nr:hypothetical protein DOTSEDRAFT_70156 [Dothistroma septosporum NZE10]